MKVLNRIRWVFSFLSLVVFVLALPESVLADEDEEIVVVIDPGHGGENLGANYDGYLEKEMNLIVANAMYEELTKYDGIKVYMTRTDDEDLSLLERAEFAESVDADFLFCLHFNMSVSHKKYGAEVWLSAFGEQYAKAFSFAEIQMKEFTDYGFFDRGIKTRLNDKAQDYYGIIRHCTRFGIPSVIIEHAHLDHEKDTVFLQSEEDLVYLGVLDATAVAKYYGLSSKKLDVDYSDYPKSDIEIPEKAIKPDSTEPDVVYIEEDSIKDDGDKIRFTVTAQDYDSPLQYYAFSLNGGETYGDLFEWTGKESMEVSFNKPVYNEIDLSVIVFNRFDLFSVSNAITIERHDGKVLPESDDSAEEIIIEESSNIQSENDTEVVSKDAIVVKKDTTKGKDDNLQAGLVTALCVAGSILVLFVALKIAYSLMKKRKRRK